MTPHRHEVNPLVCDVVAQASRHTGKRLRPDNLFLNRQVRRGLVDAGRGVLDGRSPFALQSLNERLVKTTCAEQAARGLKIDNVQYVDGAVGPVCDSRGVGCRGLGAGAPVRREEYLVVGRRADCVRDDEDGNRRAAEKPFGDTPEQAVAHTGRASSPDNDEVGVAVARGRGYLGRRPALAPDPLDGLATVGRSCRCCRERRVPTLPESVGLVGIAREAERPTLDDAEDVDRGVEQLREGEPVSRRPGRLVAAVDGDENMTVHGLPVRGPASSPFASEEGGKGPAAAPRHRQGHPLDCGPVV